MDIIYELRVAVMSQQNRCGDRRYTVEKVNTVAHYILHVMDVFVGQACAFPKFWNF